MGSCEKVLFLLSFVLALCSQGCFGRLLVNQTDGLSSEVLPVGSFSNGLLMVADDFEIPPLRYWKIKSIEYRGEFGTTAVAFPSLVDQIVSWTFAVWNCTNGTVYSRNPDSVLMNYTANVTNADIVGAPHYWPHMDLPENQQLNLSSGVYWFILNPNYNTSLLYNEYSDNSNLWAANTRNTTGYGPHGSVGRVVYSPIGDFWIPATQFGTIIQDSYEGVWQIFGDEALFSTTSPITSSHIKITSSSLTTSYSYAGQDTKQESTRESNQISSGGIAGIVVAIIVVVAIAVAVSILVLFYKRRRQKTQAIELSLISEYGPSRDETYMPIGMNYAPSTNLEAKMPTPFTFYIDYNQLKFEVQIGKGNFGVVFKGLWRGGAVAIKQLAVQEGISENDYQNFKDEAALMANLRPHVNTVQLLGVTVAPSPLCIITEFLDHGSLSTYIYDLSNKLDAETTKRIAEGIAAGMNHIHEEGLIHNDLAARNVLLGGGHQVKIADFGLSQLSYKFGRTIESGPIRWMAPEVLQSGLASKSSDVFSYGVTLFEISHRMRPYDGVTLDEVAQGVVGGTLKLEIQESTPDLIKKIIEQCMARDPQERPSFNDILEQIQNSKPTEWQY